MLLEDRTYGMLYPVLVDLRNEVKHMNICLLLTHVPNPRMNKRIEVFKKTSETKVICTRRASQNIWEPIQNVEHFIFDIDLPSAKHLIKRWLVSRNFQRKALEKLDELKPNIIYAEGLDSLIIAGKYKRRKAVKVFFEVADLRENYITLPTKMIERVSTKLLLQKEKKAFENVDYLVVTSPKFYDMHYSTLIPKEKMIFIPNAPDPKVFANYQKKSDGAFTIGFIGGIRYLNQMKMLVDVASELNVNVLFAGAGGTSNEYQEIREYCKGKDNIFFSGKYNYDREISGLYGKIDCVYSVYNADNPNVRIALPNKLYESVICELPIIVAKNTYLAEVVEEWGVGISVSHENKNELIDAIKKLQFKGASYDAIVKNCKRIKDSNCVNGSKPLLDAVLSGKN